MAVGERHVKGAVLEDGCEIQVVRKQAGVEQPLPALVPALRARAVVPQPEWMESCDVHARTNVSGILPGS